MDYGNLPTAADYAAENARDAIRKNRDLEKRVKILEDNLLRLVARMLPYIQQHEASDAAELESKAAIEFEAERVLSEYWKTLASVRSSWGL